MTTPITAAQETRLENQLTFKEKLQLFQSINLICSKWNEVYYLLIRDSHQNCGALAQQERKFLFAGTFSWRNGVVKCPSFLTKGALFYCSNLHNKVGELTSQINTLYTLVTSDHNKMNQVVTHDQTINRQEVNTLINMQQQLTAKLHEIR